MEKPFIPSWLRNIVIGKAKSESNNNTKPMQESEER
jgi:hypothetical protein